MFGYINATKEQLGEDYEVFCSYYCGLCKQIGKSCSQISRLGLSYDITFLAVVLSSVLPDEEFLEKKFCFIHPKRKVVCVVKSDILDYCANVAAILSYEKLRDNLYDDKSIKAAFGMLAFGRTNRRARKKYPDVSKYIRERLSELATIENNNIKDVDVAADKFALILKKIFSPDFITDESTKTQLEWFGYNVGRWIYIIDALNDLKTDYKNKSYNPLVPESNNCDIDEYCRRIKTEKDFTLTFTLENIASTFDLMTIYKNYELLRKIIYISLPHKQKKILNGG